VKCKWKGAKNKATSEKTMVRDWENKIKKERDKCRVTCRGRTGWQFYT
jgi:hypothetical protein